jgi:hypothetical protein
VDWVRHPDGDDVAVLHLKIEWQNVTFTSIPIASFLTPKLVFDEDVGIGDDTVMIGRFIGHDGKQRNTPSVRFGNIAMMPEEKITLETGVEQECFLVEMRSLPGYSGSAVIMYSPCAMNDMSQRRYGQKRVGAPSPEKPGQFVHIPKEAFDAMNPKGPYLLGIDCCHLHSKAYVLNGEGKQTDGSFVRQNSGMAGVIPAWKIAEIIESEELVAVRKEADKAITKKKQESSASLDSAEAETVEFTKEDFEAVLKKASRKTTLEK